MKIDKGQIYRILKNLQKKGLVEATLEYPTRFTAVPFEKVIDSFIKSKREEVAQIESQGNQGSHSTNPVEALPGGMSSFETRFVHELSCRL